MPSYMCACTVTLTVPGTQPGPVRYSALCSNRTCTSSPTQLSSQLASSVSASAATCMTCEVRKLSISSGPCSPSVISTTPATVTCRRGCTSSTNSTCVVSSALTSTW